MQISSSQSGPQVPRPAQGVPTPAERGAEKAQPAQRATERADAELRSKRSEQRDASSSTPSARDRLGALAESFEARLASLAHQGGLSSEQLGALREAHSAFMTNLHRLSAAQLHGGEPGSGAGKGLAAVIGALRDSVHSALAMSSSDEQGGAQPSERLANVQRSIAARIGSLVAGGDLSPRQTAALEKLAADFDSQFQRLGNALGSGSAASRDKLQAAFTQLLQSIQSGVHAILGGGPPAPTALYSPSGAVAPDAAGGQLEHLA